MLTEWEEGPRGKGTKKWEAGKVVHRCPAGPTLVTSARIIRQTKGCAWCGHYPPAVREMADVLD
jgi:hypothetical protein